MDVFFFNPKIEVDAGKTFFNILNVQNKTAFEIEININYNSPRGWTIIGSINENIVIPAHETVKIPVHAVASKNAVGGVGYVVVAAISDKNATLFKTEYCFINVPIKTGLTVVSTSKDNYFDHKTLTSHYDLKIANTGNIDEIVNIKLIPDQTLTTEGSENNFFLDNIALGSKKDTTLRYTVMLKNDDIYKNYSLHKMFVNISGEDTLINKTAWFKFIDWKFSNYIPETDYPLIIELTALNIFSEYKTRYLARISGKLLFKKRQSLAYSFENMERKSSSNNLWINSRFLLTYQKPQFVLELGDIYSRSGINMYGRGLSTQITLTKRNIFSFLATTDQIAEIYNMGAGLKHNVPGLFTLEGGYGYSFNKELSSRTYLPYAGLFLKVNKQNRLSILGGVSETFFAPEKGIKNNSGYGFNFDYTGKIQKMDVNIRGYRGSSNYMGYSRGRTYLYGITTYDINDRKNIYFSYAYTNYSPAYLSGNEYIADKFTIFQSGEIIYKYTPNNNVFIYGGPSLNNHASNSFSSYATEDIFSTISGKAELSVKLIELYTKNTVTITGRYGLTYVDRYAKTLNGNYTPILTKKKPYNIAEFIIGVKRKYLTTYFIYYHGPSNISQQYSYFYSHFFSKSLNLSLNYDRFLYKKILNVNLRASYYNNVSSKNSRVNLDSRINLYIEKGWEAHFTSTFSLQNRANISSQSNSLYTSTYFEVGVRKVFDFNQPRIKYMDMDAFFYKDLNGNRFRDPNEPGVGNVLTDITRANPLEDAQNPDYNGEFMNAELMSNPEGQIAYKNMPEGRYKITYLPTGISLGNYSPEKSIVEFDALNDTTLYIPFMERNKVFGKIVLHRDKYSALGEIPLDNVRIFIEGNDKIYTVNTDKSGYFEAYIPVSDYYTVKVQNAFYENFQVRQEYYIVKFNGYKQFELSFEFDEKKREVKFDDDDFVVDDNKEISLEDVALIRQTNLRGTVRDEMSQQPIHAEITIRNADNNDLITETVSSERTGVYFTTFFAGKNYSIKAVSPGYWTYFDKLEINQITTFDNITRDIMLRKITLNEKLRAENLAFNELSSELSPAAKAELDNIIAFLLQNPTIKVEVSGHADEVEALKTDADKLSGERAKAVFTYLKSHGLPGERLEYKGKGISEPLSGDPSDAGRAKNRRTDIKVIKY